MKKHLIYTLLAIVAISISGCTTVKRTAQTADVSTAIIQYPIVTDLDILPKASASVTWSWNPLNRISIETRKGNLVAQLLKEKDADVLLEEQFIVKDHGFGSGEITVTGYPAKFTDFRKATEADLNALKVANPALYNVSKKKR